MQVGVYHTSHSCFVHGQFGRMLLLMNCDMSAGNIALQKVMHLLSSSSHDCLLLSCHQPALAQHVQGCPCAAQRRQLLLTFRQGSRPLQKNSQDACLPQRCKPAAILRTCAMYRSSSSRQCLRASRLAKSQNVPEKTWVLCFSDQLRKCIACCSCSASINLGNHCCSVYDCMMNHVHSSHERSRSVLD